MNKQYVDEVKVEIDRLLSAIDKLERCAGRTSDGEYYISGEYTAAVRRASMDLTKSLVRLRRG